MKHGPFQAGAVVVAFLSFTPTLGHTPVAQEFTPSLTGPTTASGPVAEFEQQVRRFPQSRVRALMRLREPTPLDIVAAAFSSKNARVRAFRSYSGSYTAMYTFRDGESLQSAKENFKKQYTALLERTIEHAQAAIATFRDDERRGAMEKSLRENEEAKDKLKKTGISIDSIELEGTAQALQSIQNALAFVRSTEVARWSEQSRVPMRP